MSELPPPLIIGRVQQVGQDQVLAPLHRETVLIHQQRVAALIECAMDYAHDPGSSRAVAELLRVAATFTENT
jgi:hypothetical protein